MRINQVVIIPEFSKSHLGNHTAKTNEYDVMGAYIETLIEYLEIDRICFYVASNGEVILPNSLILYCSVGWDNGKKPQKYNFSKVSYAQKSSKRFADFAMETLSEWGKCHVDLSHKCKEGANAKAHDCLRFGDTIAVQIEPFLLNGPNSDDYIKHVPVMGRMLAQCIYEFMSSRDEIKRIPATYR